MIEFEKKTDKNELMYTFNLSLLIASISLLIFFLIISILFNCSE